MNDLRKFILKKRSKLSKNQITIKSLVIEEQLIKLLTHFNCKNILIYLEMNSEVIVSSLSNYPQFKLFIPKIVSDTSLKITEFNPNNLILNPLGFYESNSNSFVNETIIDAVIVPGVVFDNNCYRIGYGMGYYDRLLPKLPNATKIGVGFEIQVVSNTYPKPHDYQLDYIITESKTLSKNNLPILK